MKNTLTVAKYTFIEVYRSKVMVSIFFMALGLLAVAYVASEFAYGAPAKVALDFSLGLTTVSNLIMAIFIGATLIRKEIDQRTLYMVLSRSISRSSFLVGKVLGLSIVLFINTVVLNLIGQALFHYLGGSFQNLIYWCMLFSFFESLIVMLFAILFSLITNTALSVIFTVVIFIAGHSINETSKILIAKDSHLFSGILKISNFFIPNFYKLNLKDFVLYKQSIPLNYLLSTEGYGLLYIMALLFAVAAIFKNKNLD